jgi:hypothetical protein
MVYAASNRQDPFAKAAQPSAFKPRAAEPRRETNLGWYRSFQYQRVQVLKLLEIQCAVAIAIETLDQFFNVLLIRTRTASLNHRPNFIQVHGTTLVNVSGIEYAFCSLPVGIVDQFPHLQLRRALRLQGLGLSKLLDLFSRRKRRR